MLSIIKGDTSCSIPEPITAKHATQGMINIGKRPQKTMQKPLNPFCDIQWAFLRVFQHFVIGFSVMANLGWQTETR